MRMWMVDPKILCTRHLLGEHYEIHMFYGCLCKRKSIRGYIKKGLFEFESMQSRHDALADEISKRNGGKTHISPLHMNTIDVATLSDAILDSRVPRATAYHDLITRCKNCAKRAAACLTRTTI